MSTHIPTLKVVDDNPRGWKIINARDFDASIQELWTEGRKAPDPSERDALKAEAADLGLSFPANIPTAKLAEMVAEANAEADALDGDFE